MPPTTGPQRHVGGLVLQRARSGDVINEQAVHNLDVCNWLIGAHPGDRRGLGGTLLWKNDPPGRTNMDGLFAELRVSERRAALLSPRSSFTPRPCRAAGPTTTSTEPAARVDRAGREVLSARRAVRNRRSSSSRAAERDDRTWLPSSKPSVPAGSLPRASMSARRRR